MVVAVSAFKSSSSIGGRIVSYLPFNVDVGESEGGPLYLEKLLPDHPLLRRVKTLDGGRSSWRDVVTLQGNATLVARWTDGTTPLVAVRGRVVGLNFYAPSANGFADSWSVDSDGAQLMANALQWGIVPQLTFETLSGTVLNDTVLEYVYFFLNVSTKMGK